MGIIDIDICIFGYIWHRHKTFGSICVFSIEHNMNKYSFRRACAPDSLIIKVCFLGNVYP